jgi:hypothetical protein
MAAPMVAIVRTARMATVLTPIVRKAIAPRVIVCVRKASGSGRGAISATVRTSRVIARTVIARTVIVRMAIVPKVIARVPSVIVRMVIALRATVRDRSAIVRMVRRGATAHMVIVPTVTARRAIVRAPTAALAASVAAVVVAAVAALPSRL